MQVITHVYGKLTSRFRATVMDLSYVPCTVSELETPAKCCSVFISVSVSAEIKRSTSHERKLKKGNSMAYSIQYTLYSIQYTLYSIQHTAYSIQYTLYSIQYTAYNIQYTAYSIQYTVYSIQYSSRECDTRQLSPPFPYGTQNSSTIRNLRFLQWRLQILYCILRVVR
jgi:hypothetical protein